VNAVVRVKVPRLADQVEELPEGQDVVVGSVAQPEGLCIVVAARGVSRRHVLLRADGACVSVEDLGSTYHTLLDGLPIRTHRVLQPTAIGVGDATLLIEPAPPVGPPTERLRARRVTRPAHRRALVALCRDHLVRPHGRGTWVLTYRELSHLFNDSPNENTFGDVVQAMTKELQIPAGPEALIDWAIVTGEVGPDDVAWLDDELRARTGQGYEEQIRKIPRFEYLRLYRSQR